MSLGAEAVRRRLLRHLKRAAVPPPARRPGLATQRSSGCPQPLPSRVALGAMGVQRRCVSCLNSASAQGLVAYLPAIEYL